MEKDKRANSVASKEAGKVTVQLASMGIFEDGTASYKGAKIII